jgi:hypothetical protein
MENVGSRLEVLTTFEQAFGNKGKSVDWNLRRVSPTHKTKLQNQPVRYTMFFVNNLSSFC